MIYKCPFCGKEFIRVGSHKCENRPIGDSDLSIRIQIIKYNYYDNICNDIIKDYNDLYSICDLQNKYNITSRDVYNILQFYNIKLRTLSEAVKLTSMPKIKQTCMEKYNVSYFTQTDMQKEKTTQTCLQKYGCENVSQSNVIKQKKIHTCLQHYNTYWPLQNKEIQEKAKQTCLYKYGVSYISQLEINKIKSHSKEANLKRYLTLKQNNTFNKSKPEEQCYELLKEKYSDIIRQYHDERYPFNCDFYIPSLDLFIEYQGSHYHQGHPFDENDDNDINTLNILKEKSEQSNKHKEGKKSQYDNIIYTWTDLDVKKRNSAKENELNYIEFWDINEVKQWLKN